MYEEKDYILRLIHEIIRTLAKLLFHIDWDREVDDKLTPEIRQQYRRLQAMIDGGQINEAENLLTDSLDPKNRQGFLLSLRFYDDLNRKDNSFLEKSNYSRQEVYDGLKYAVALYGCGEMMDAFTEDFE